MAKCLPRKGDRHVVTSAFDTIVLTHWFAPVTGGNVKRLPVGLEFEVDFDAPEIATGVSATPLAKDKWERVLVEQGDRDDPKYAGYSLSVAFEDLAANCSALILPDIA